MTSRPTRASHQFIFLVLASGVLAYAILQSVIVPVLPEFQRALHTSQNNATWVLTANLLAASICTPIMGRIGDLVGKKRIYLLCLVLLAVGCLICGAASSLGVMIVGRVIQGVGGGVLPLAFGIVRDEFPADRVAGAVGRLASITAVGMGAGIVLGGPIVHLLNYRWLALLPLILIVLASAATYVLVPESPQRSEGRISWLSATLLSAWLVALLLALSKAPTNGWGSGTVLGLLLLSALVVALWVLSELRARVPFIDMRMMTLRAVWTTNVVSLLYGVGMYSVFSFITAFAQTPREAGYGFGVSVAVSGLLVLPTPIMSFAFGQLSGSLVRLLGGKGTVLLGCLLCGSGLSMLTFVHGSPWQLPVSMAILGCGHGLTFAALAALVVAAVPPDQTGVASGMNANIRTIGGAIGAALMSSIITSDLQPGGLPKESGYTASFAMLVGTMVVAAMAALFIPAVRSRRNQAAEMLAGSAAIPGAAAGADDRWTSRTLRRE